MKTTNSATILENSFGFRLPAHMVDEFENHILTQTKKAHHKLNEEELNDFFCKEYIENTTPFEITAINFDKEFVNTDQERLRCKTTIKYQQKIQQAEGIGNGTLNALANAISHQYGIELGVVDYLQHGLTQGSHALAASYILADDKHGHHYWGVGIDTDCTLSAIRAFLSALNRSQRNSS